MQLTDNTKQSYAVEEYGASKEFDTMKFTEKLRALRRARIPAPTGSSFHPPTS